MCLRIAENECSDSMKLQRNEVTQQQTDNKVWFIAYLIMSIWSVIWILWPLASAKETLILSDSTSWFPSRRNILLLSSNVQQLGLHTVSMMLLVRVFGILLFRHSVCTAFAPTIQRSISACPAVNMMKSMYERVLEKPKFPAEWPYKEEDFTRMDETDDTIFYNSPRL